MIFGKYQLLELLGTGGMAEVFKAKSYGVEGFEKLLVIKRILSLYSDNEEFVEMFVNEAKIAVSLNHANIVQIYDLGKAGDSYFMAMEYVQGMDLAEIIEWSISSGKPFPLEAAIHILCEVAKGLDYAHRKKDQDLNPLNIIHRDISPQNILISQEGEVKITDFGIAQALNIVESTEDAPVKGKFAYMAPEQAIAAPHDKRVDIFSAGVVFYELLTGINPLKDHSPAEIIRIIHDKNFPDCQVPCCGVLDAIPVDLEPILRKALAPNPADRYESAAELYEALLTFSYMEGLRAGASALSEYILPLVEARDRTPAGYQMQSVIPGVTRSGSIEENASKITSVRRPSNADLAQFDEKNAIQLTSGIRDIALLAYSWSSKNFDSKKLQRIVESFGAVLLEKEETSLVFGFGVQVASDALVTAARTAHKISIVMSRDNAFRAIAMGAFGASIHHARLAVELNGRVKLSSEYKTAVDICSRLSQIHGDSVLFEQALLPQLLRVFEVAAFPHDDFAALYKLCDIRSEFPAPTKLAGRRPELKLIGDMLAEISTGKGRILALTGTAGAGKSRIMAEVKRRLTAGGHQFSWFESVCSPWQKKKPLSSIQALLRNIAGVTELDAQEVIQEKLHTLETYPLPSHEREVVNKLILSSQVPENIHVLKSAIIRIIRHSAAACMTIVAVDHLTAIDDESLALLQALSHRISDIPVLLVVAIRLGYVHGFEGSPLFTQCDVAPLSKSEMEQIIHACVPAPPEQLVVDVLHASANLPGFAEEFIQDLRDRGALKTVNDQSTYNPIPIQCPLQIRDIVASELFSLPRDRRTILQMAACLGEKFDIDILALLVNRPVEELSPVLSMLAKVKMIAAVDETSYGFPSPFIQDAVYQSIEPSERQLIHRTMAQRIEQEYPQDLEKYAEPLAIHYLRSNAKKAAFDYLIIAAQNAAIVLDHETAVRYYLLALDLTLAGLGSVSYFDIFEQLVQLTPQTSQTNAVLMQAILVKSQMDDENSSEALAVEAQESILLAHAGEYQLAIEQLRKVIASQSDGEAHLSKRYLAEILLEMGSVSDAMAILTEITENHPPDADPYANAQLTICMAASGDIKSALVRIEAHNPSISAPPISILYLISEGICLFTRAKYELAREAWSTALTIAKQHNMKREAALLHLHIAKACLGQKDFKQAFEQLRDAAKLAGVIHYQCVKDRAQIALWCIDAEKFGDEVALGLLLAQDKDTVDVGSQILTNYCLGRIYANQKNAVQARQVLLKTKMLMERHNNHFFYSQVEALLKSI